MALKRTFKAEGAGRVLVRQSQGIESKDLGSQPPGVGSWSCLCGRGLMCRSSVSLM